MSGIHDSTVLFASPDFALLAAIEPALLQSGARVEVVLSAEVALAAMNRSRNGSANASMDATANASISECAKASSPPDVALLDARLPGMPTSELLARARAHSGGRDYPILLTADEATPEWIERLADGVLDDLILRSSESSYWLLRIDLALRAFRRSQEVEALRESAAMSAQLDRLTRIYNREALLALLFRETDRVQRQNSAMTVLLFDLDDFGHWNSRLGTDACDELLCQVTTRTARLLRSYDLFGRPGMDEFLLALPGCGIANAVMLAERLRLEVFSVPFHLGSESIRLSACFGIACSLGRSPVVVLREAEQALLRAKAQGPEAIQCFDGYLQPSHAPVTFLCPTSGDELIAW
jgi:two-component system, cell cycle response regulator